MFEQNASRLKDFIFLFPILSLTKGIKSFIFSYVQESVENIID